MFVRTLVDRDFTLFYFDRHGSLADLVEAVRIYLDRGPTLKELFYFDTDAQFITPVQMRQIIPFASRAVALRGQGARTALLYGRDSLYGLGRIYKVLETRIARRPWTTEVFKDLGKANAWLDIPPPLVPDLIAAHNVPAGWTAFPFGRD